MGRVTVSSLTLFFLSYLCLQDAILLALKKRALLIALIAFHSIRVECNSESSALVKRMIAVLYSG